METVRIILTGKTPLLMHADNIEWADKMEDWKNNPENRAKSKAGDDRTPPWRWIGCLYYDDPENGVITVPSENIMKSIMEGAAKVSTGKRQETFKALSQSGLLCSEFHFPLLIDGKKIPMKAIAELRKLKTFGEHVEAVKDLGFSLFSKRARIGTAKHIRVRPRFDRWRVEGEVIITDDQITKRILQTILDISGNYKGIGDWRPSSKTPGVWGTFTAEVL